MNDKARQFNDKINEKIKAYADKRHHVKPHKFKVGDSVLVRQKKINMTNRELLSMNQAKNEGGKGMKKEKRKLKKGKAKKT